MAATGEIISRYISHDIAVDVPTGKMSTCGVCGTA